jgi:UDP:flavonoid glycosyltransferase YjiC (YdhE family)
VYGHLYPLIPLATATRVAGHDVMFGTGTRFAPKVRALNFEGYTIGLSVAEAENEARRRHDDVDQTQLLLTMFADVLSRATLGQPRAAAARPAPDLMIYEQSDTAAASAARRAGLPFAAHLIGGSLPGCRAGRGIQPPTLTVGRGSAR